MIEFSNTEGKHKCYSEREGELITFKCPLCPDYKRTLNTKTGEVTTNGTDFPENWEEMTDYERDFYVESLPQHYGTFVQPGLDVPGGYTPN